MVLWYCRIQWPGGLHGNAPPDHSLSTLAPEIGPKISKLSRRLPSGLESTLVLKEVPLQEA